MKVVATKSEQHFGKQLRMTTLVDVANGDAYALTCADRPDDDGQTSPFCRAVFKSFRLGDSE